MDFIITERDVNKAYLFIININTKYLIAIPVNVRTRTIEVTKDALDKALKILAPKKIEYLRGDADRAFGAGVVADENSKTKGKDFYQFLKNKGVKDWYFSRERFTNKSKCVDRVARTIRDMIGLYTDKFGKDNIVQEAVKIYNNTPHSAYFHKFTPLEAQNDYQIEGAFIRYQQARLREALKNQSESGLFNYQPGNVLMIYIPQDKSRVIDLEKRRRNFSDLAIFISYYYGNVECLLLNKVKFGGDKSTDKDIRVVLPIYHTKYVCEDINSIPEAYRKAFIINYDPIRKVDIAPDFTRSPLRGSLSGSVLEKEGLEKKRSAEA
jgi:hypothetical protein